MDGKQKVSLDGKQKLLLLLFAPSGGGFRVKRPRLVPRKVAVVQSSKGVMRFMEAVFVYGTLLTGESNYRVAAPFVRSVQPGAVYGRLYDCGLYPKLTLCGEGESELRPVVVGEWLEVSKAGLRAMDVLEGYRGPGKDNEYERVWITDARDGGRSGWIYVGADVQGLPLIPGGSWRGHRALCEGRLP